MNCKNETKNETKQEWSKRKEIPELKGLNK